MTTTSPATTSRDDGLRITALGFFINTILVALKLFFGFQSRSRALIADGLHSLADLLTDLITALGLYLGSLPPDEDHPFGHQKIETIAEILMGGGLVFLSLFMMMKFGTSIYYNEVTAVGLPAVIVAGISFIVKEVLFRKTIYVSERTGSKVIFANAWHHRTDALSSLAILIGLTASYFIPSLQILDAYLSLFVALIILFVGVDTGWDALKRIVDTVPEDLHDQVKDQVRGFAEVRAFHNLKMRYIGNEIHMELHIEVDPKMSVYDAHAVAHRLRDAIMKRHQGVYDVMVHVEPVGDERFPD